jgi:hypothetical protein
MNMTRPWLPACLALCFGCSAEPLPPGHYRITLGQETDTYSRTPSPIKYTASSLSATESNAPLVDLAVSDKPIESIDVPPGGASWYTIKGEDSDGVRRVQATSFAISGTTMAGYDYPLFAGRTDVFCRPPGALVTAQGDHPPSGMVWGRYLWIVGGSSATALATDSYDLVGWGEASAQTSEISFAKLTCPEQPCKFESFATYSFADSSTLYQYALGVGASWAIALNVYDGTSKEVNTPTGLSSWADLAGGRTLTTYDGAVYVIGATRSSAESTAVLEISTATESELAARSLNAPRKHAAATYIEKQGLIVLGGSATAAGAEVLAPGSNKFTTLPYPPDEVQGAALVAQDSFTSSVVWRIGGRNADGSPAASVAYDLSCTQDCQVQPLTGLDLDVVTATGFFHSENRIVVGEQADGTMVAWRLSPSEATPIEQRQLRRSASAVQLPNGFVALVGGTLVDGSSALGLELVAL